MKTLLKICGITNAAFACEAERLGANYLGFIFAPGTPRAVTPEVARAIVRQLSGRARRVGVFLHQKPAEILSIMRSTGLDIVQLHRRATAEEVRTLQAAGFEVWTLAGGAIGSGVLFDSSHGDGETAFRKGAWKSILAGGISATNLAEALAYSPDVIDVSSSLESERGVKSIPLLQNFIRVWNNCRNYVSDSSDEGNFRGRGVRS